MTPTEATNRITSFVRQRVHSRWWPEFGGVFTGLVAETIAELDRSIRREELENAMALADQVTTAALNGDITQPIRIPISAAEMNAEHVVIKVDEEVES